MTYFYSNSQLVNYLFLLNIVLALLVVVMERRKPSATWAWLLVMLFLPGLGFVLYLLLGQDLRKERLFYIKEGEERELYALVQEQEKYFRLDRLPLADSALEDYKSLIHLHFNSQALYTQDNCVKYYADSHNFFQDLRDSIQSAQKFVHLEYYIIRNDSLGTALVNLLTDKARSGVEVKLLYDGQGCQRLPRNFFEPLKQAGGEVASFFPPLLPYINLRMNYRNHRKICLIDGQIGFTGGGNIGDEYLGISRRFGNWRDSYISIRGSALDDLELRFLLDWRYAAQADIITNPQYFPPRWPSGDTGVQIVSSGPDSKWAAIKNGYLKMISLAQRNIYLQTPYFVPDDSILEALKMAALSGVEVNLMLPAKPDHPFIFWASLSYVGELLESGVRCFLYHRGFMHSKLITADGLISTVGTANLDIRSFELNFEVNAFIYDAEVTKSIEHAFREDLRDSRELTLMDYLARSRMVKVKEALCRLLSPLL